MAKPFEPLIRPQSALGLFNTFSLSLLAQNRYLAVLYDEKGEVTWMANRKQHAFSRYLDFLSKRSLFETFDLPAAVDLKELFGNIQGLRSFFPSVPEDIREWVADLMDHRPILVFPSRNIYEKEALRHSFVVDTPLSQISLFHLSGKTYLGIVSLSELFFRLSGSMGPLTLVTGADLRIRGYSLPLGKLLGIREPRALLHQPLPNVLEFEMPSASADEPARFRKELVWKNGEDPGALFETIDLDGKSDRVISEAGLSIENPSESGYVYLKLNLPTDFDREHVEFSIRFKLDRKYSFPNLMARTRFPADPVGLNFHTPDDSGYNFAREAESNTFSLKRSGSRVHTFAAKPMAAEGWHTFTFRKFGTRFEFRIDEVLSGEWHEIEAHHYIPDTGLCLFLRPGTAVRFSHMTVRTAPAEMPLAPDSGNLRTVTAAGFAQVQLTLSARHSMQGPENTLLWEFTDLTSLQNKISRLEEQKSKLLSILKPETGFSSRNAAMAALIAGIPRAAESGLSILIEGETGTGKEVLARALHEAGPRKTKPFVKIDCMAIPETLMEAELFGYEKGAFTGAQESRPGRFEQAHGGTVFLDEIANLSLAVQMKLLNVLQDFRVQRLGGNKQHPVNVQIIAASNILLSKLMAQGRFRSDLYYRLDQIRLRLPPLRDRREDLPVLAERFTAEGNALYAKNVSGLEPGALAKLDSYTWPGNVRELRNVVLRAVLFAAGDRLKPEDIRVEPLDKAGSERPAPMVREPGKRPRYRLRKEDFMSLLKAEGGNLAAVGRKLNMGRQSVYRFIKRFNLNPEDYRKWE